MKFKIPCEWRLRTVEEIEAKNLVYAQDKAMTLTRPQTLEGAEIEPIIGVVDWERFQEMHPLPKPKDPMEGWEQTSEPGPYAGGQWEMVDGDLTVVVFGDTGPIEVGMGHTTYHWRVSKKGEDNDRSSKKAYDRIEQARDAALEAARKWV
jgi:hypothetical protein